MQVTCIFSHDPAQEALPLLLKEETGSEREGAQPKVTQDLTSRLPSSPNTLFLVPVAS